MHTLAPARHQPKTRPVSPTIHHAQIRPAFRQLPLRPPDDRRPVAFHFKFPPRQPRLGYQPRNSAMIFGVGVSSASSVPWRVVNLPDFSGVISPVADRVQIWPNAKSLTAAA